jgi:hypothetical protein
MKMSVKNFVVVATLAAWTLWGCGGGGGGTTDTPRTPAVRAVNASPDSTALDFLLDDRTVGSKLPYLGSAADFANVDAGDYDLIVRENAEGSDIDNLVVSLTGQRSMVAVAVGLKNFGTENLKRLRVVPIEVDRSLPNGNKARLIVVNGFSRATGFETPSVDFQDGENPQFKLEDIEFGRSKAMVIDAGSVNFQARRSDSELVYAEGTQTFGPGKIYLAVVAGIEGEAGTKAPRIHYVELRAR